MTGPCSVQHCPGSGTHKGMCAKHALRVLRHGDPHHAPRWDADPAPRFWARVDKSSSDCWLWAGKLNNRGYGVLPVGRRSLCEARTALAHRFAYELLVGPIPEGLQLDHLCRVRHCVNPAHLEPVTPRENTRRAAPANKTHCKYKHKFTPENTYRQPTTGRRCCDECRRLRNIGVTASMHAQLLAAEGGHPVVLVAYTGARRIVRGAA